MRMARLQDVGSPETVKNRHFDLEEEPHMANAFGTDILIQAPDPKKAAAFYVECLGFTLTSEKPMIELMALTSTSTSSKADTWTGA
jgi:hypothetical protein